jgi:hypothetical protein
MESRGHVDRIRGRAAWAALALPALGSCGPTEPAPCSGPLESRAPYIQMLGTTSVVVAFQTPRRAAPEIDFGTSMAYDSTRTGPDATAHAIELTGLSPGQRYYYRVRAGDDTLAAGADAFFETDAGRGDGEFSFFVTADIGVPGGAQASTAARILATMPRAEIGLLAGDIVYPDGRWCDYDRNLMRPWTRLLQQTCVWAALGNHDWHVDPEQNFRRVWYLPHNEHYYSFERANAHFIALDTREGEIYDRQNQMAWLRADLAAHRDAGWTFVFLHHPAYTCTYKGNNLLVIWAFVQLFDEFQVDVVFAGHAHTYERLYPIRGGEPVDQAQDPNYADPSGTIYIVTGAGGTVSDETTRDCSLNATFVDRTVLFSHVTVERNRCTIRAIESSTGLERDRMTITKAASISGLAPELAKQ